MKSKRVCYLCERPWRKGKNYEKIRKLFAQGGPFTSGITIFRKRKEIIPKKKIAEILEASKIICIGCGRRLAK